MIRFLLELSFLLCFYQISVLTFHRNSCRVQIDVFNRNYGNTIANKLTLKERKHPYTLESPSLANNMHDEVRNSFKNILVGLSILAATGSQPKTTYASVRNFILPECSDSITILRNQATEKYIVLIGTAHISEDSVSLVRRTIRKLKPSVVMIELDSKRIGKFGMTTQDLYSAGIDVPEDSIATANNQISPSRNNINAMGQLLSTIRGWFTQASGSILGKSLGQFYKSVEKLGFTAGGEFQAAIEEGRAINSRILLGDRDVTITLEHLASAISNYNLDAFNRISEKIAGIEARSGIDIDSETFKDKVCVLYVIFSILTLNVASCFSISWKFDAATIFK